MKKWAILVCKEYNPGSVTDDALLLPLLEQKGVEVEQVIWDEPQNWDSYDRVIVRSPWDYVKKYDQFMKVLEQISQSRAKLDNPFELMKNNSVKTYLGELEKKGVDIIPTFYFQPDQISDDLIEFAKKHETVVTKPTIGASSSGLQVFKNAVELRNHKAEDQTVTQMCQPLLNSITEVGEFSLIYFNGEFSHSILKTPKQGEIRCQDEFGSTIKEVNVNDALKAWGKRIVDLHDNPLYARVDYLLDSSEAPRLMELELIEPCLFFSKSEGAAQNFIKACEHRGYF